MSDEEQKTNGADTRGEQIPPHLEMQQIVARVDSALAAAKESGDPLLRLQTDDLQAVLTYCNNTTQELQQQRALVQRYMGALEEARQRLSAQPGQVVSLGSRGPRGQG